MKTKRKAILYARVAATIEDQKPNRLQFQIDALTIYCQDNNIEIVKTYSEVGSANDYARKELQLLLSELRSGKVKADLLLITEWGRMTRDILFSGKQIYAELKATGITTMAINSKTESDAVIRILTHKE
jgi:predicted site-specific integrase-resolvase